MIYPIRTRAQHQMVRIAQNNLRTGLGYRFRCHRFDRACCAYRHEGRSADITMRGG